MDTTEPIPTPHPDALDEAVEALEHAEAGDAPDLADAVAAGLESALDANEEQPS